MAPTSSDSSAQTILSLEQQSLLLQIAQKSILFTLEHGQKMKLIAEDYPEALQQHRASFVTLRLNRELRGCIGTLEAYRPLVVDVAHNAHAAAFSDPRFLPVAASEYENLEYHISILNPAEEMDVHSEEALLRQLRPGIDGLIIQDGAHRGTFLPSVWEQLPTPEQFIQQLKLKAGLSPKHWSPTIQVWRYTTTAFP